MLSGACELAAQQAQRGGGWTTPPATAEWEALDAGLTADAALCALWGLSFSARGAEEKAGEAERGGFGGARPPAALTKLLEQLGKQGEGEAARSKL